MATPTIVRQINEITTLRALYERGPMTRADIARELGVTKSTITKVVAGLSHAELVRDHSGAIDGASRIGRPGTYVGLNPEGAYFAGAEIGVDRLDLVVLDLASRVVGDRHLAFDTPASTPEAALDEIKATLALLCKERRLPSNRIRGLCVSVPGFVSLDSVLLSAPKVGWREVPMKRLLDERFKMATAVENDANVSAFAEWYLTPDLRNREILLILLESGVGGGLIASGRLVRGAHGLAGEVGHIPVAYPHVDGYRTTSLPWEDTIGKSRLLKAYAERGGALLTATGLREAIKSGEPAAVVTATNWARWLARGIAVLTFAHDPDTVIIGGELAPIFVEVQGIVEAELRTMLPEGFPEPTLTASRFQSDGCAIGAAAMMHARQFADARSERLSIQH